jgi:peptidyl-prolyl cis-trans isomerase D
MISWIQKYFQHHFRTIFAVILGLMIISFVFTIGPSGLNRAERHTIQRNFFGYNLSSEEGQKRLMGDASISANLQFGSLQGVQPEQVQNYAFQRAASLHLADEMHIPESSPAEISDFIKGLRSFMGQDGQFDATAYKNFRDNLKGNARVSEADIARVVADDVRAQKVQKLLAGPGYVLPADVKLQLARTDTSWTLATATADYASFTPDVKPSEADLAKFYEENSFRYDIPPRVVASYVSFPSIAYLSNVNVSDAEVRAYYDANPAKFPKPFDQKMGNPTPGTPNLQTDPNVAFAVVRPQVETALKLERAQSFALKAASDFRLSLYQKKITPGPALDELIASRKLTLQPLQPFTLEQGPAELGRSQDVSEAASRLGNDNVFSDAVPTPSGAVVLVWKESLPVQKPAFAEVRAKVAADYVENEKRKRFVELGRTLRAQIEARLKAGDNFEKAVAAVSGTSGVKLQAKTLPAFTARTRPQDLDNSVSGALEHLEKGQVSDMLVEADKGVFVYAVDKKVPDLSEANPQYAATRAQLSSYTARLGASAVISEMVEKELKRTEPKL